MARRAGRAARVTCIAPHRLTSNACRRSATGVSSKAPATRIPALATTASRVPPVEATTRATASSTARRSVTSTATGSTDPPKPAKSDGRRGAAPAVRSNPTTRQPHRARSRARASPIPLAAPVTIAVRMGRGYERHRGPSGQASGHLEDPSPIRRSDQENQSSTDDNRFVADAA